MGETVVREPSSGRPVRVGEWLVEPALNRISCGDREIKLRPKVMDVLAALASRPEAVVCREELIDTVWAKEYVADSVLASAISELRSAFGDDAQSPRFIETIPKRGYRLVAPVSPPEPVADRPGAGRRSPWPRPRLALGMALATLVAVLALVEVDALRSLPQRLLTQADAIKPRVAILPFVNLGPAEQAYFATGLADEVTARLSATGNLTVIAGSTSARFASSGQPPNEIGRGLGADYVVSGSVRWQREPDGSTRVRIVPRLIRVADDTHIWAETYDRDARDVLGVQAEIARQVVSNLDIVVTNGAKTAVEDVPTLVPEAYEAYLRGLYYLGHQEGEESQRLAASVLQRAVELDPNFVLAWAELARAQALLVHYGFDRSQDRIATARRAAARVRELAPGSFEAHLTTAQVLMLAEMDYVGAGQALEAAAQLRPNDPIVAANQGFSLRRHGDFAEALPRLVTAWSLSGGDPTLLTEVAVNRTVLGQYAAADGDYARAIALMPDQHTAYEWRAYNTLLWTGDVTVAQRQLDRVPISTRPSVAVCRWRLALLAGDVAAALARLADLPQDVVALQSYDLPRELLMGETYRLMGDDESARESFEQAALRLESEAEERPDDARVYSSLALAYAGLGLRDRSIQASEAARALWPPGRDAIRNACRLEMRARSLLLLGEVDAAVAALRELAAGPIPPYAAPLVDLDPRYAPVRQHPDYASLPSRLRSGAGA